VSTTTGVSAVLCENDCSTFYESDDAERVTSALSKNTL